jgi:hypothetical protein
VASTCRLVLTSFVRRELRNEMKRASDELRHHLKMRSNLLRVRVRMLLVASVGSISDFYCELVAVTVGAGGPPGLEKNSARDSINAAHALGDRLDALTESTGASLLVARKHQKFCGFPCANSPMTDKLGLRTARRAG